MPRRRRATVRALTVAGSDSSGGAGIQADLATFAARGVYGATVLTAVTVQDTRGVYAVHRLPAALVRAQLEVVLDDLGPTAIKIGMLGDAAIVTAVADVLAGRGLRVVLDPVLRASGGTRLLQDRGLAPLRARLLPLAEVVTPNLAEASTLVGAPVRNVAEMRAAAHRIRQMGARAVVVTGGHLPGAAIDVLVAADGDHVLHGRRVAGASPHGTGCTFAAAIAAELAKGATVVAAVRTAKRHTATCIARARRLGGGRPVLGHRPWPAR
jgi:hydroxymethylpyrimidine/phosphomethylpyrimidine kinase